MVNNIQKKVKLKKRRLDETLVRLGYFPDLDSAKKAVIAHEVRVGSEYPSSSAVLIEVNKYGDPFKKLFVKAKRKYVSRGGYKLQSALLAFQIKIKGKNCIDVGSSTGGFSDCLLQSGAASVTCVDVNYGQLAWQVRQNPRVKVFERTNIKFVDSNVLGAPFDIVVADVSFISLAGLSGVFASLCKKGSGFIGLVKPQFESAHNETQNGVVIDEVVRQRTVTEVKDALEQVGFRIIGVEKSPIKGPAGNIEFLIYAIFESSNKSID